MDQNQNDNLFDNDNPPPQQPPQPSEPTQIGGGARIYQTPSGATPDEPRPYTPPPTYQQPASAAPEEPRPYTPPPSYQQPPAQPPKKSNTVWIIVIVVIVLLCCCCLGLSALWLWNNGDALMRDLDLSLSPYLALLA